MHGKIIGYRRRYGDNWLTVFPDDGLEIPWRQLTLQEFLNYDNLFRSGRYTVVEVEDEIFSIAVLEPLYVTNIDILPAGMVSTVVAQILYVSGPSSPEQISNDLNIARTQVQDFISSAATLICSVYPAYTPEEVFNLKYDVFMRRLAMAEKRLLELGMLKQPLTVECVRPDGTTQAVQSQELPSQRKRREILEAQRKKIESKLKDLNTGTGHSEITTKYPEGVITQDRMNDPTLTFIPDLSNDPRDYGLNKLKIEKAKKDAIQGLEAIYPEYFKIIKEGKKLTPDIIMQIKGSTKEEVKQRHKEYIDKIVSGEIKVPPPTQQPDKTRTAGKIKVKRR